MKTKITTFIATVLLFFNSPIIAFGDNQKKENGGSNGVKISIRLLGGSNG